MKQINLKEYYPFYTTDTIVEVPDEVADILRAYKLRDEAYRIYTYRHKAYFSLDFGDGIEYEALVDPSVFGRFQNRQFKYFQPAHDPSRTRCRLRRIRKCRTDGVCR